MSEIEELLVTEGNTLGTAEFVRSQIVRHLECRRQVGDVNFAHGRSIEEMEEATQSYCWCFSTTTMLLLLLMLFCCYCCCRRRLHHCHLFQVLHVSISQPSGTYVRRGQP